MSELKICPVCQKNPVAKDRKFCSVRCSNVQQARTSAARRSSEPLAVYIGVLEEIATFQYKHSLGGFGYRNKENAIAKLNEEFLELLSAIELDSRQRQEEELGDLLYMIVSVCRLYSLDLMNASKIVRAKLRDRIKKMRSLSPLPLGELSDDEQTAMIQQIKISDTFEWSPESMDDSDEFTPEEVEILIDALQKYDAFAPSAEKHTQLCQLVVKVQKLEQNHEEA